MTEAKNFGSKTMEPIELADLDDTVVAELKDVAQQHKRMEYAVRDLSRRLPFEHKENFKGALTLMRAVNNTEDGIQLIENEHYQVTIINYASKHKELI